ncbi:MAG: CYTH domain-containing protein, partial [Gammaproteobacteria bacterium]
GATSGSQRPGSQRPGSQQRRIDVGIEIERKFRVHGEAWRIGATGTRFRQGYLVANPSRSVRVRVAGSTATLTIKGAAQGALRAEFEYTIPLADAETLLETLCERPLIEKTRWLCAWQGYLWEVDEFEGDNAGLVIAELELAHPSERPPLPPWVGEEVTDDPRYLNANLIRHPWRDWGDTA